MNDFQDTPTVTLREMAVGLKGDAKALFTVNKCEAVILFRLYRRICQELRHREYFFPAVAHLYN